MKTGVTLCNISLDILLRMRNVYEYLGNFGLQKKCCGISCLAEELLLFGALAKLRKATVSFVMSVCLLSVSPSACSEQLLFLRRRIFVKLSI
jgi:hypothetical protein